MALASISIRIPEMGASFPASLVPIRESSKPAASFTSLCPHCEGASKVNQVYMCPNDAAHGPIKKGELAKGREVAKGKYVRVTDEEAAALKEPTLEANQLELTVFRSEDVDNATTGNGTGYFLAITEDTSSAKMLFDLLVANPDKTLVGEMTLGTTQKMFRLGTWNRSLFLQEVIRPTEIATPIAVGGVDYKAKLFPVYEELFEEAVEEFDPTAFASKIRERIAEFDQEAGGVVETTTASAHDVNNATLDELEALLAAKRAAKTPAKKKATKKEAA